MARTLAVKEDLKVSFENVVTQDPDPHINFLEMLDPDPYIMNTDPQL